MYSVGTVEVELDVSCVDSFQTVHRGGWIATDYAERLSPDCPASDLPTRLDTHRLPHVDYRLSQRSVPDPITGTPDVRYV